MSAAIAAALALVFAGLAMPAPAAGQTQPLQEADAEFEALHAAYLADGELQHERPGRVPPPEREPPPGWLQSLLNGFGNILDFLAPAFRVLFYLALAAIVLAILYFLLGEALNLRLDRLRRRKPEVEESHVEDFRPEASLARSLLEEADKLAAEGRFAEAVHLLLFRSIEDIQTRQAGGVPPSLTAREIGGLASLPRRARTALSPIIAIVERSFFGGRAVDRAGWERARASYEQFAFGEAWA